MNFLGYMHALAGAYVFGYAAGNGSRLCGAVFMAAYALIWWNTQARRRAKQEIEDAERELGCRDARG